MEEQLVGKVSHYFDHIGVAVIKIEKNEVKLGDLLHFSHGGRDFYQKVNSLEVEKKPVEKVKAGEEAGMKVDLEVKPGDAIYK
jgi:hypothetical protein